MDPTPRRSFSMITLFDIRFGSCGPQESNLQRKQRMMAMYDLTVIEANLLIGVDDALIDGYGRIAE